MMLRAALIVCAAMLPPAARADVANSVPEFLGPGFHSQLGKGVVAVFAVDRLPKLPEGQDQLDALCQMVVADAIGAYKAATGERSPAFIRIQLKSPEPPKTTFAAPKGATLGSFLAINYTVHGSRCGSPVSPF